MVGRWRTQVRSEARAPAWRSLRIAVLSLCCVLALLGCGGKAATGDAQSAAGTASAGSTPGSGSLAAAGARCSTDVAFLADGNQPPAPTRQFPTPQLFPRDIPDRGTQMAVNTNLDGKSVGWVEAKPFRGTYVACADSAFAASLAAGGNPCEVGWVQTEGDDGAIAAQGTIDVRYLQTAEGAPLTPQNVDAVPSEMGFFKLFEKGTGNGAWFAKAHVQTAVRNSARCPVLTASAPQPPANGEPSGDLQLLCEYQNGQAIVVRVDARARSASVRLSTDTNWVTFVDGQTYNGTPPLVDAVSIDEAAIRIMRTPSDLGPEAKVSNNQTENDLANLVLGLGAVLATSSSAVIDRNTGVIRSEGMGGVFLHKGVGNCQPWEGRRF